MNPLTALLLGTKSPTPAPGTPDPDTVTAGWWGFVGLLFLSIAVFFLWRSMNKQLTRVTFDEVPVDPEPDASALAAPVDPEPLGDETGAAPDPGPRPPASA